MSTTQFTSLFNAAREQIAERLNIIRRNEFGDYTPEDLESAELERAQIECDIATVLALTDTSTTEAPTRLTVRANGDANSYALLDGSGRWFMSMLVNGEQMEAKQEANLRRLAACWNACEGISTSDLENLEQADSAVATAARVLNFQLIRQRNKLLDLLAELLGIDLTETARLGGDVPAEELMERIKLAAAKRPA